MLLFKGLLDTLREETTSRNLVQLEHGSTKDLSSPKTLTQLTCMILASASGTHLLLNKMATCHRRLRRK